jgi:hypothetical protein
VADKPKNRDVVRTVSVMFLNPQFERIQIKCKCGHKWTESEIPSELNNIDAVAVFNCPSCGQGYGRYRKQLARMLPDGSPDMSTLMSNQLERKQDDNGPLPSSGGNA